MLLLEFLQLAVYVFILCFLLLERPQEALQPGTGCFCALLVRLALLDFANGALHLSACALHNVLRLLLRALKNLLFLLAYIFQLLLVSGGEALQLFVGRLHLLQFLVQGLAPADYLAKVALYAHEFVPGPGFGVVDYGFRKPHLAGQLEGEGVARKPGLQHEQRLDLGCIEEHGPVDYPGIGPGSI